MHLTSITLQNGRYPDRSVYPFNLRRFQDTGTIEFPSNVTFFAGENGSGKSTLLKAMAKKCGVHIWAEECWDRAHYNQYEEVLYHYLDASWAKGPVPGAFFSAETYDHMTRMIDVWASGDPGLLDYFGGKSLLEQSHGESFMSFFRSRYTIEGIYFLDEPESALSPKRQIEFVSFLNDMGKDGHAQFIIATHSPILLSCPRATLLFFDAPIISPVNFLETEHYRIYHDFFCNKQ